MFKIRTGYSFRNAAGKIEKVMDRLEEIGSTFAPMTDRASTFGFYRWKKLAEKRGLKPVYGVELAVTNSIHAKKPAVDYWTFIAEDSLEPINRLVKLATTNFRYQPLLTLEDAISATGVSKMTGNRPQLDWDADPIPGVSIMLSPSSPVGVIRRATAKGWPLVASDDNRYPREGDRGFYEVLCGRNAETQSYPQHILTDDEWLASIAHHNLDPAILTGARARSADLLARCTAELQKSSLPHFEAEKTLKQMCIEGAAKLGCDLTNPEYDQRLNRELDLIEAKGYQDYFYIVADICEFARKTMMVGPARGSSCGSLVCYLLGITTIDPIPYGLIFERFVDINRTDMPDIDIDFSDQQRYMVFDYINHKYGSANVARLGTVAMFQPRSALVEVGAALSIPRWQCEAVAESMIKRSSGDSRALNTLEDTLATMPAGQKFISDFPEARIITEFEGHPRHAGQHAAGIVISSQPITNFVALDHRTGATMCDKKDAEGGYNLLKIDALGLTQLSVFEDALELAGLSRDDLQNAPLDDPMAFKVLNDGKWSGIFQFNGMALQSIAKQFHVDKFDDIVNITALARPGPLASGGAHEWVKRRNGQNAVTFPHPVFEPYLSDTLGIVLYQEQVMEIGRNVGGLDWGQVTALRKAMSKSLGKEFFDQFGDPWKAGAIAKGVDPKEAEKVWDDLCAYGAWSFNKCIAPEQKIWIASVPGGGRFRKYMSIEDLYHEYIECPSPFMKNTGSMPVLWSINSEGVAVKQKAKSIIRNPVKTIHRYHFDDGSYVDCTPDHKFLIGGDWKPIGQAAFGDSFKSFSNMPQDEYVVTVGKGHSKGKSWKGTGSKDFNRSAEGNIAWTNGASKYHKEFIAEKKSKNAVCECCGAIENRMEAHHTDFCHGKKDPKGLVWLCVGCHKRAHHERGRTKKDARGLLAGHKILVNSEVLGESVTYDIEMPEHHNFLLENGIATHNSHSVAYGLISYWCCWLKANFPFEFAAATLSHESDPGRQIQLLREMNMEGYDYVPVDPDISGIKWAVGGTGNSRVLVGPLSNVKGIGPKMVHNIISCRARKEPLPDRAKKLLIGAKTSIDSLWPVRDAFKRLMPDPLEFNIVTHPTPIINAQITGDEQTFMFFCTLDKINPRDENEAVQVARRGYALKGRQLTSLNLQLRDDTDTIFGKIDRFNYEKLGRPIVERGRVGKALYAIKGTMRGGGTFRMLNIKNVRYVGEIDQ